MKKFITLLAITSLFIGCEIDEDLNDNPNAFTDAPIGLIINHALLNVAAVAEAAPARVAAMFTDQLTGLIDSTQLGIFIQ
jgi:ABC-type Fe3+-hydroxamate transport system substrate-binding protein